MLLRLSDERFWRRVVVKLATLFFGQKAAKKDSATALNCCKINSEVLPSSYMPLLTNQISTIQIEIKLNNIIR